MAREPGTVDGFLLGARKEGIAGKGILATFTFQATADGNAEIAFGDVMVVDSESQPLPFDITTEAIPNALPSVTALLRSTNPLRSGGTLAFTLAKSGDAQLDLFSVDGRRVRRFSDGPHGAGLYRFRWDGRDNSGNYVSTGVYYVQLRTAQGRFTSRLVYMK